MASSVWMVTDLGGGNPNKTNILLFSEDPIALDATVCRLIDLEPERVPTIKYGMGDGTYMGNEIILLGDNFVELKIKKI